MNPSLFDMPMLLMAALISSLRTLIALSLLPMFTSPTVPAEVRVSVALAIVVPVVAARLEMPMPTALDAVSLTLLVLREAGIGLVIGLAFGALAAGLQTAGDIIDHQTGLTFSQNIDPFNGNSVSLTAQFLERVVMSILLAAGILLVIIDALHLSYELWPVGRPLPSFERLVPLSLIEQSGRLFSFALLLAGPALLVLFVVDAGLGMLNRAAPQFSIFSLTLTLKPIIGLMVLVLALPMIIEHSMLALIEAGRFVRALISARS